MRFLLVILLCTFGSIAQRPRLLAQIPLTTPEGFAVPQPGYRFSFPRDHGNHPDFKIEWWYVTGHLHAEGGRRFGFQATFFRSAGPRSGTNVSATFGSGHIFLAHMALLDTQTGKFFHQEKLNREGWDAASSASTLAVLNGPWSLRLVDPADTSPTPRLTLNGSIRAEVAFNLTLTPAKPLVVFGDDGVSRKGDDPTAASYYLTFSRLRAEGELTLGPAAASVAATSEKIRVTGEAWMDHEISSSQLSGGQVGWDWLSVQFTDGRELMLYQLRRADGTADPASTLAWVDAAGKTQRATFSLEIIDRWKSPTTGASYPSRLRLTTTDSATNAPVRLLIEPLAKNQELTGALGGIPYWEGACRIRDDSGRELGSGFLELTGYAQALKL